MNRIEAVFPTPARRGLPPFRAGDTVRVHVNITEGEKSRIQVFEGVVLRRRGRGPSETFTVRKISYGVGVERVFPTQSPSVAKIEIRSRGHVRRSRLYYLRELRGKKARLRTKVRDVDALMAGVEEEDVSTAAAASDAEEATAQEAEAETSAEEPAEEAQPETEKEKPEE